jgi:hypothetical protein
VNYRDELNNIIEFARGDYISRRIGHIHDNSGGLSSKDPMDYKMNRGAVGEYRSRRAFNEAQLKAGNVPDEVISGWKQAAATKGFAHDRGRIGPIDPFGKTPAVRNYIGNSKGQFTAYHAPQMYEGSGVLRRGSKESKILARDLRERLDFRRADVKHNQAKAAQAKAAQAKAAEALKIKKAVRKRIGVAAGATGLLAAGAGIYAATRNREKREFRADLRDIINFEEGSFKLYYFKGRNTGIAARSVEEARAKKKRGGDELVAVRTPSEADSKAMAAGRWVRTRRDGKSPDQSSYGKGRGYGPPR